MFAGIADGWRRARRGRRPLNNGEPDMKPQSTRMLAAARTPRGRLITLGVLAGVIAVSVVATSAPTIASTESTAAVAPGQQRSFADLVERVQPAVVNVSTRIRGKASKAPSAPFNIPPDSPFREFFERHFGPVPEGGTPDAQGVGSGFIVDAQGHVVTNHHVVRNADEIVVTLSDGTELPAKVVGHDDKTDLALLKLDTDKSLPFVRFGDSDGARVGDWVVAVGSPFGLGGTVTAGIISARGRNIQSGPFDDFLQVDAPINRGNSGGPLFDQNGQVIGVNAAIFSPSGGNVGIGFAIPSQLAAPIIEALKSQGYVERGWMGVSIQPLSPELAESFGLDEPRGALVAGVLADGPAARAGISVGDVIVRFGDEKVQIMRDLPRIVAAAKAGIRVPVEIVRNGEAKTLTLDVGEMPGSDDKVAAAAPDTRDEGGAARLGLALAPLDDETRQRLELDSGVQGAVIAQVQAASPAALQGLRPGDVILRVGTQNVTGPQQVIDAVHAAAEAKRKHVVILVSRRGNERFVAVPFAQS
jgi:serine protease Do